MARTDRSPSDSGATAAIVERRCAPATGDARDALEFAHDAFFMCTPSGLVEWMNAACADMLAIERPPEPDVLLTRLSYSDRKRLWHYAVAVARSGATPMDAAVHLGDDVERRLTVRLAPLSPTGELLLGHISVPVTRTDAPPDPGRLHQLEELLERFARELEAFGVPQAATSPDQRRPLPATLPERQRQVVRLLLAGLDVEEIAATLFLSPHTVRNHNKAAFRTLGVRSRLELLARYHL